MEPNQTQQKSNGALIGSVIIIVILIMGGIYFWQTSLKEGTRPVGSGSDVGATVNPADIEANVNNINLDNLDKGI